MRAPHQLIDAFRSSGRKVTPQRERIFRVLHDNPTHPTAEAVHAEIIADMPSVSLRTVYATLHELAEMGELVQLDLGTGSSRFDPNTADHHHLVCATCGRVQDLDVDFPEVTLADGSFGFEVDATQIVFRGRCRACAAAGGHGPSSDQTHPTETPTTRSNTHG